jgi:4-carboxymuconolactone decarboxylase
LRFTERKSKRIYPKEANMAQISEQQRITRGETRLEELNPGGAERLRATLADIAPDFADMILGFAFGEVHSRPDLDLRTRQLVTVGALIVLGNAEAQLKSHIRNSLRVGCTRTEIVEVAMQMAVYAGMPAAINGLYAARAVFAEREESTVTGVKVAKIDISAKYAI